LTEYNVKLRAGSATAKNVRLYPFVSVVYKTKTGSDGVLLDESALKGRRMTVSDTLQGVDKTSGGPVTAQDYFQLSDAIATKIRHMASGEAVGLTDGVVSLNKTFIAQILTELDVFLLSYRLVERLSSSLKVLNVSINEEELGSGIPAKLHSASVDGFEVLNTTDAHIEVLGAISPRLTTDQKTPKGWNQGHRSRTVTIYVLGRNTAFDEYLDEDGDSKPIYELRLNCRDKDGNPTGFYIYNATPISADPVLEDREGVVYAYRFSVAGVYEKPHIGIVKMSMKPISAPLSIIFTHPEIHQPSSFIEEFWNPKIEIIQPSSELDAITGVTGIIHQLKTVLEVTTG
jgi:hypothetical protein